MEALIGAGIAAVAWVIVYVIPCEIHDYRKRRRQDLVMSLYEEQLNRDHEAWRRQWTEQWRKMNDGPTL